MPAAAIKGIIVSISIITALGVAVLENPQIQAWLEQQRQNIIELLRQLGEDLDPQSRQAAEAFAFPGRTPEANDAAVRREESGSLEAAAIATGRSLESPSTIRRIPVRGPSDPEEAEERRRKGREYLAQRNQQMYELKERRKAAKGEEKKPAAADAESPTSFDAFVDKDGKLKAMEEKDFFSFPSLDEVSGNLRDGVKEGKRKLVEPILEGEAMSSTRAWQLGSQLANPFGDEFALDRSVTPKPPVPPKVALTVEEESTTPTMPGSFTSWEREQRPQSPLRRGASTPRPGDHISSDEQEELTYEEQLAIALSLSEAEAQAQQAAKAAAEQHIDPEEENDPELRAAIAASLKDMKDRLATQRPQQPPMQQQLVDTSVPLVDLTTTRQQQIHHPTPRSGGGNWELLFDQAYSPTHEPLSMTHIPPMPFSEDEDDELYRVTPQLTHARLADLNASQQQQQRAVPSSLSSGSRPYDPVREAAGAVSPTQQQPQSSLGTFVAGAAAAAAEAVATMMMEGSFYSAASSAPSPASSRTMEHERTPEPLLIDVSENTPIPAAVQDEPEGARTPVSRSEFSFRTDNDDEDGSETFASMSAPASRPISRAARSEVSDVEVVDLVEDSDVDMLSEEEGDGIATPDSWTEVGSRDGESEMGDDEEEHPNVRLSAL